MSRVRIALGLVPLLVVAIGGCAEVADVVTPTPENDAKTTGTPGEGFTAVPGDGGVVQRKDGPRSGEPVALGSLTVEVTLSGCNEAESVELMGVMIVAFDAEGGMHEVGTVEEANLDCAGASFSVTTDLMPGDYVGLELRAEGAVVHTAAGDMELGAFAVRSNVPFTVDEGGHTEVSLPVQISLRG